jgi:hypothetical protein
VVDGLGAGEGHELCGDGHGVDDVTLLWVEGGGGEGAEAAGDGGDGCSEGVGDLSDVGCVHGARLRLRDFVNAFDPRQGFAQQFVAELDLGHDETGEHL